MTTSPAPNDDLYLVQHIREALAGDPRTHELELTVHVTPGRISVTGTVATEERRRAVGEVVQELCPERDVHNATRIVGAEPADEVEELP